MNLATLIIIAFSILAGDNTCGSFPDRDFGGPDMPKHTRIYANSIYGYSVRIPNGLAGYSSPSPTPQHGFGIVLSWEPRAYISFDGSYNAWGAKNVSELQEIQLKWVAEKAAHVVSIRKYRWRIGPLSARRFVAHHRCNQAKGTFIEDTTIALHRGIVYTATLLTTKERYQEDKVVMERMMRDWRSLARD
jgi:hypothetical protein